MAEETRRIPAFLSGPTTPTAVLFPLRVYVGWFWLKLGLDKLYLGWLSSDNYVLVNELRGYQAPGWFEVTFFAAAEENELLFQWLIVGAQLFFGAMMLGGAVTRVAGAAIALMSIIYWIGAGFPAGTWAIPMAIASITLAIAAAGRYLGLDAILRTRMVKVPLF